MDISEKYNRAILENMISGYALHSIVTDEDGNPVDYKFIDVNKAFEEYTGLSKAQVIGRTIREVEPSINEDTMNWIEFYGKVALTGESDSVEDYSRAFNRWYRVNAYCPEIGYFAVIFIDITELKLQADALSEKNKILTLLGAEIKTNEQRLNKAQKIAGVGNWELDLKDYTLWASEEAFSMYGLDRTTPYIPFQVAKKIPLPEYRVILDDALQKLLEADIPYDLIYEIETKEKEKRFIHSLAETERDSEGRPAKVLGVMQDVTKDILREKELNKKNEELSSLYEEILASEEELKQQNEVLFLKNEEITALYEEVTAQEEELKHNYNQLIESMEKLKKSEAINSLVLEASAEGIWHLDVAKDEYMISHRFLDVLGYTSKDIKSINDLLDLIHPEDKDRVTSFMKEHSNGILDKFESDYRIRCKDGTYKWVKSTGKILFDCSGEPYLMAGSFQDLTKLKEQQLELEHLAYHDILTDLPNRSLFLQELEKALAEAVLKDKMLAVIFIDLDNFKDVNDTFGHSTGDNLLQSLSSRLKDYIRKQDILTRLGGDEFALMITDIDSEAEVFDFCQRIKDKILEPFLFNGYRFNISPSMGIAMYRGNETNGEELLKNADTAMYRSKNIGKNTIQMFQDYMRTDMLHRITVESHLRSALKDNKFTLHYQPQVCLQTGRIRAFEALVRWTDEELGIISPMEFIPVAESAGLIVPLGQWILAEACKEAQRINSEGENILISVNISAVQLRQLDFVELVKRILLETGLRAELLELEVTETTLISSFETTIEMFEELRKMGVKISLDDFGTGYSSLSYLKKLPIDTLKIDQSFIKDLDKECIEKEITESIVSLVHKLNIEVIAEGVETGKQLAYLMQCKCDNIQGYLISKPVPAQHAKDIVGRNYKAYMGVHV